MRIAVISDLHLGRGDVADPFGHDDAQFLRFLRHLEGSHERIVLLGDVWELLRGVLPGRERDELRRCREAHPEIAKRFDTDRYVYVHGNHDLAARDLVAAPEEWCLEADGMRLLFMHGHRHDWLVRNAFGLTKVGIWLGGWLARLRLQPVVNAIDRFEQRLRRVSPDPATCSFQEWAMNLAAARGVDVAVTGHTHLDAVSPHGGRVFLNSGTCSEGRTTFLSIDTRRTSFEVLRSW